MPIGSAEVPIIDVRGLVSEADSAPDPNSAAELHQACLSTGFFVLTGHGMDSQREQIFEVARSFFGAPQHTKESVPRIDRYGFVPHSGSALDRTRASDRTEYLDLGLGNEVDLPAIDGFELALRAYQDAALGLAGTVLSALAIGLGLEAQFFAEKMMQPQCRLRMLHYPPTDLDGDGNLPVLNAPHTDYGAITLLATDGLPGLEVKPAGAPWTPVEAPVGSLVVNLGDMLARWTNDVYRSTVHRVLGGPQRDRYSIPFFVNPDPMTTVEVAPSCVGPDRPARYEPVTAGEFLAGRIDGSVEPYVDPEDGPATTSA